MTLLWVSVLWVLASAAVAMLPMRQQYVPGVALLMAAPVLIVAIVAHVGWFMGALALAAFVSMYRNPLRYLVARLRGQEFEVPR